MSNGEFHQALVSARAKLAAMLVWMRDEGSHAKTVEIRFTPLEVEVLTYCADHILDPPAVSTNRHPVEQG